MMASLHSPNQRLAFYADLGSTSSTVSACGAFFLIRDLLRLQWRVFSMPLGPLAAAASVYCAAWLVRSLTRLNISNQPPSSLGKVGKNPANLLLQARAGVVAPAVCVMLLLMISSLIFVDVAPFAPHVASFSLMTLLSFSCGTEIRSAARPHLGNAAAMAFSSAGSILTAWFLAAGWARVSRVGKPPTLAAVFALADPAAFTAWRMRTNDCNGCDLMAWLVARRPPNDERSESDREGASAAYFACALGVAAAQLLLNASPQDDYRQGKTGGYWVRVVAFSAIFHAVMVLLVIGLKGVWTYHLQFRAQRQAVHDGQGGSIATLS